MDDWLHHSRYGLSQWEMTLHCNFVSHWLSPYQGEYGLSQWEMTLHCNFVSHWLSPYQGEYGLSQWETTLHCNVVSHWLSPYQKRSLYIHIKPWDVITYSRPNFGSGWVTSCYLIQLWPTLFMYHLDKKNILMLILLLNYASHDLSNNKDDRLWCALGYWKMALAILNDIIWSSVIQNEHLELFSQHTALWKQVLGGHLFWLLSNTSLPLDTSLTYFVFIKILSSSHI